MKMHLNLPILDLQIFDSIGYQKCLIPKVRFPANAVPGQWAKCYFYEQLSGKEYYTVSQVFPRDDLDNICYLDICVTDYGHENDEQLILNEIIVLKNKKEIQRLDVILQLRAESFIENSKCLTKTCLLEMMKILLQKYQLANDCLIKDKDLLDKGVDCIRIEIDQNCDNSTHIITDNTYINIKNISLTSKTPSTDLVFLNVEPFTRARQELENLMKCVHSQRRLKKHSFPLSFNALLVGAIGCGKSTLIEEFLQRHHCNVFHIKIIECLKQYPGETEAELRKIFKAAYDFENTIKAKDPTVILLEDIHLLFPHLAANNSETLTNYMRIGSQLLSLVDSLSTTRSNIMCLATTSQPDNLNEIVRRPGRFENEISVAALREDHRSDVLKKLFAQSLPNFYIRPTVLETMAKQTQGYVIGDLALLVRNVAQMVLTRSKENFENIIFELLKKSKPISLKASDVTAYKTTETFESIGGMIQLKNILEVSVLAGLKHRDSFKRFNLSLPKGVLLYGPPGCAKTTIAKCLATEANMTFIATSAAEVYSPYVGCAEKFIANIFQTARKNSPCLIFLDEIDSLVGRRSLSSNSNSGDVQIRILSTLLTEMDGVIAATGHVSSIIVVAATNRPDMVDDALMRPGRFDKLIHVPAPDLLTRRSILDLYKRKMPFSQNVDLDYLAAQTENYSGADICNLCNEAALQALQRDFNSREIVLDDFKHVLKTSKSSLGQDQIDWYYKFENKSL